MRESDEQFLERFLAEIEPAIDPLGRIAGIRMDEDPDGARVRIVLAVDGQVGAIDIVFEGDSLLDAAAGWPARVTEARLALAFRELVGT